MKKQSTGIFGQLSTKQMENLTDVVRETLAIDFCQPTARIFTAADLWSIQRQGKSRLQRRYY